MRGLLLFLLGSCATTAATVRSPHGDTSLTIGAVGSECQAQRRQRVRIDNTGTSPVDLSGARLTIETPSGSSWVALPGVVLEPSESVMLSSAATEAPLVDPPRHFVVPELRWEGDTTLALHVDPAGDPIDTFFDPGDYEECWPCGEPALAVRLPAPSGSTARFGVRRVGTGMDPNERATCLLVGSDATLVPVGETAEVAMGAHSTNLQRIEIGGRAVLIWVAPDSSLRLLDDDCYDVALSSLWLDPYATEPPNAMCRDSDAECPAGWSQVGPPGPIEEPLCEAHDENDAERRCVRDAFIRGPSLRWKAMGDDNGVALTTEGRNIAPRIRGCATGTVESETDRVGLAIHPGARWSLWENDGRIVGAQEG